MATGGLHFPGILVESSGTLTVRDSVIRNFNAEWHQLRNGRFDLSHLLVSNTLISDNGINNGIAVNPTAVGNR